MLQMIVTQYRSKSWPFPFTGMPVWTFFFAAVCFQLVLELNSISPCFCQLQGNVDECSCKVDTVDSFNNYKVQPIMSQLVQRDFFRFIKVNLNRPCPFWQTSGDCVLIDCVVNQCSDESLPPGLKGTSPADKYSKEAQSGVGVTECPHKNDHNDELSALDTTISEESKEAFHSWRKHDDRNDDFCEVDDENSADSQYVDLSLNPERYTAYKGASARRIWKSIYEENCFRPSDNTYGYITSDKLGGMCLEKRAFFRAVSGLHASINVHLSSLWRYPGKGYDEGYWGPNVEEFKKRFDPEKTFGQGPTWLKNLYFVYLLELRALAKISPYLDGYSFYTGNKEEETEVKEIVSQLLSVIRAFPDHFDESQMFQGDAARAAKLKEEFRLHFYNISRIMDCVGCYKCRLWGKTQVLGLGTALKILFSHAGSTTGVNSVLDASVKQNFQLRRTEIVALFNGFARLSNSIKELHRFRELLDNENR